MSAPLDLYVVAVVRTHYYPETAVTADWFHAVEWATMKVNRLFGGYSDQHHRDIMAHAYEALADAKIRKSNWLRVGLPDDGSLLIERTTVWRPDFALVQGGSDDPR